MRVFVDTSVILAALGSKTGGSSLVLALGKKSKLQLLTSSTVIEELRRNIPKINVPVSTAENLVVKSKIFLIPVPTIEEVEKYEKIAGKDAHVLASATGSKAEVLITLDKKHLLKKEVKQKVKTIKILTPGELLQRLTSTQ